MLPSGARAHDAWLCIVRAQNSWCYVVTPLIKIRGLEPPLLRCATHSPRKLVPFLANPEGAQPRKGGLAPRGCTLHPASTAAANNTSLWAGGPSPPPLGPKGPIQGAMPPDPLYWAPQGPKVNPGGLRPPVL